MTLPRLSAPSDTAPADQGSRPANQGLVRKFTGIEIDPGYFDIAVRRIEAALKQPDMFIDPPKPIKQEAFL